MPSILSFNDHDFTKLPSRPYSRSALSPPPPRLIVAF